MNTEKSSNCALQSPVAFLSFDDLEEKGISQNDGKLCFLAPYPTLSRNRIIIRTLRVVNIAFDLASRGFISPSFFKDLDTEFDDLTTYFIVVHTRSLMQRINEEFFGDLYYLVAADMKFNFENYPEFDEATQMFIALYVEILREKSVSC